MRRPGLWVANGHPGDPTKMLSWRPGAITCFYDYLAVNGIFEYKAANAEVPIIVRFQHPLNWHQDPPFFARRLGELVASKWNDMKVLDPYVYFANEMNLNYENGDHNPANEQLYTTPEFYQKYADWVRMTADVVKNIVPEMKLVTPPFSFGHHEDGTPDDDGNPKEGWAGFDFLYETVRDYFDNVLTFHAYWGHTGGSVREWLYDPELSSWYAFRWQRLLKLFETRYNINAKMIIDEAGNFATSDADFADQIIYFTQKCLSDDRVICVTFFLWLDPTNHPGNLPNSWVQGIKDLDAHLDRLKNLPDLPPIRGKTVEAAQKTIRVLFDDNTVQTMPLEEYLRAVVPAEMPALWPIEAVKAQAIVSRSYARYAIEHPRHPNADICTNPAHCQNYDAAKIHPKSDEAIEQTKNIIARYNGATVNGIFCANCGGRTRNNEAVFNPDEGGAPVPYLRGVPCPATEPQQGHGVGFCQHGARVFAQQGHSYEAIIKHYYTGVTLGPPTPIRTSSILGTILDHSGRPASMVKVTLSGEGQTAEAISRANGAYRFNNVPGGRYALELPVYQVRRENVFPTPGQDLTIDLTLPDPSLSIVTVQIERAPGLPLIVGDWGQAGVPILVKNPRGVTAQVISGSKPEYGPGGFETYTDQIGNYVLEIDKHRFEIPMNGQFTRLTFRRGGVAQPTGIVEGTLRDQQGQPISNRLVNLASDTINLNDVTDEQGYFLFENLPAASYTVTVEESDIRQTVTNTGQNRVTLSLNLAAPPGAEEWQVDVERSDGLPFLAGDVGLPNEPVTITNPRGFQARLTSGSQPDWGAGGFEIYAPEIGNYMVQFLGQSFTIPMGGQFTRLTFRRSERPMEEARVRLLSSPMSRSQAEAILQSELEADPDTQGVFEIVEN